MALKLKFRTAFPADVAAVEPLTIEKDGLRYIFSIDPTGIPAVINGTPITGGTSGGILYNNAGVISNTDLLGSADLITSGKLSITPPTATLKQGLVISQNTPSTGSTAGPYHANEIIGTWTSTLTGGGGAGGPETMHQLNVQLYAGGPNFHAQSIGAISGVVHHVLDDTSPGDMVGIGGFVDSTAVRSQGKIYGIAGGASIGTGGSVTAVFGQENNMFLLGTGNANYVVGFNSLIASTKAANTASAAYVISSAGGSISPWTRGLLFSDRDFGSGGATNAPIASTGHAIHFDYTGTIDTLINAPNVTMTNVFNTPNTYLTGGGILQLGRGASPTSDGGLIIAGATGAILNTTYQFGATAKWTFGATASQFFLGAASGPPAYAITVNNSDNLVSLPSGATVSGVFTLAGSTSGGLIVKAPAVAGSNTITLPAGTTDFSATGGSNQFVAQTSVGGALTVVQPSFSNLSGSVAASQMPALTGDITTSAGAVATTLATVNSNVGTFGSATQASQLTVNAKGLVTAASNVTVTPAVSSITGLGTGIATALGVNVGSAGAPVLFNGAGGTPSSLTLTNATGLPTTGLTGTLQAAQEPAHTGDVTNSAGSLALTLATVNSNVGTFGSATQAPQVTVNAKGLVTAVSNVTVTPAIGSVTGLGTGIASALAVNTGSAGAPVLFNGAGGTPSAITLTNGTGLPVAGITPSTSTALGVGSLELGHASDTTISRVSAGVIAVEGSRVGTVSSGTNSTGLTITFDTPGNLVVNSYFSRAYSYQKIDKAVVLSFNLFADITQTTASGNLRLTGLPFTAANDSTASWRGALQFGGITKAGFTDFVAAIVPNTTELIFVAGKSGADISVVSATDVPTGTVRLQGSITYWTD